jgi:hypothetical protein
MTSMNSMTKIWDTISHAAISTYVVVLSMFLAIIVCKSYFDFEPYQSQTCCEDINFPVLSSNGTLYICSDVFNYSSKLATSIDINYISYWRFPYFFMLLSPFFYRCFDIDKNVYRPTIIIPFIVLPIAPLLINRGVFNTITCDGIIQSKFNYLWENQQLEMIPMVVVPFVFILLLWMIFCLIVRCGSDVSRSNVEVLHSIIEIPPKYDIELGETPPNYNVKMERDVELAETPPNYDV